MFNVLRTLAKLFACFWFLVSLDALATQVDGLRVWRAPDHTRLVFDLSAAAEHKLFTMSSPDRVVIDFVDTRVRQGFKGIELDNTPIAKVRYGTQKNGALRVVLDLKTKVRPRSFFLKKHAGKSDRLVVDLEDIKVQQSEAETVVKEFVDDRRDIIIAIDAGHGGEDPGALGKRILEKNVVLSISQRLKQLINQKKGYRAHLTRTGDYYIPLRKRRDKARQLRADLFISIHADAFNDPRAKGASVFALSARGATSESARFLARKENEADLIGGVGGVSLNDKDDVLAGVLVDLSMTATMSTSLEVGDKVLKRMGRIARLHKKNVEQAGFAVLKSPDVPSILVETGFISNPSEAKKLATQSYRNYMAKAIFDGVIDYFSVQPPTGTYIASKSRQQKDREHIIGRGDTLSEIAKRYNVSVASIIKYNSLSSAKIRVGQKLRIPTS